MIETLVQPKKVHYPSSDGEPMAETHIHVQAIMLLHQALEDFFRDREDVFVASDIFWFWEEGNTDRKIAPDVMVIPGTRPRSPVERRSFYSWEENASPAVVFEMASEGTWRTDLAAKRDKYQELKVHEYFIFDPEVKYIKAPIIGYRSIDGSYARMEPGEGGMFTSDLGFGLRAEEFMLRVMNLGSGSPVLTRAEQVQLSLDRLDEAQRIAEREHHRADAEKRQAEAERQRAESEKGQAEFERQRANALAAEVERLTKLLGPS